MSVVAKRLEAQNATWYGGRLLPGDIVLDEDPAPSVRGTAAPTFRPMSIVAKRSPISAAGELLSRPICITARDWNGTKLN